MTILLGRLGVGFRRRRLAVAAVIGLLAIPAVVVVLVVVLFARIGRVEDQARAIRASFETRLELQLETTRAIRLTAELNRQTPIFALTASVLPEHVRACLAAGMDDHLGKPIVPRALVGMLAKWVGQKSSAAANAAA